MDMPNLPAPAKSEMTTPMWFTNRFLLPKENCLCRVVIDGKEFQAYRTKGVWHLKETQDSPPVPASPKVERWRYE